MSVGDQEFDSFKKIISDLEKGPTEEDPLFSSVDESSRIRKFVDESLRGFAFENESTISSDDLDLTSKFESALHDTVRSMDSLVVFGSADLRQHLTLAVIKHHAPDLRSTEENRHRWVVVLVKTVKDEEYFKEYLSILLYLKVISSDDVQKEERYRETCLKYDLLFFEPDFFQACLVSNRISLDEISLIVFRNFEEFLQDSHPYRSITDSITRTKSNGLRIFGLIDHLSCSNFKEMEENLRRMKESCDWTCVLGCFRPYSLTVSKLISPILFCGNQDKMFISNLSDILRQSQSMEATLVLQVLKQYGPLCAQDEAEDLIYHVCVDEKTKTVLEKFLDSTKMALLMVKLEKLGSILKTSLAVANNLSPTLILTKNTDTYIKVKNWLLEDARSEADFPSLGSFDSEEMGTFLRRPISDQRKQMFLATFGDLQAINKLSWPSVILFDLPKQVYCDDLLRESKKVFVITSSTKWHDWEEGLLFLDSLEKVTQKINNDLMSVD